MADTSVAPVTLEIDICLPLALAHRAFVVGVELTSAPHRHGKEAVQRGGNDCLSEIARSLQVFGGDDSARPRIGVLTRSLAEY
jgi:hypothetical protein